MYTLTHEETRILDDLFYERRSNIQEEIERDAGKTPDWELISKELDIRAFEALEQDKWDSFNLPLSYSVEIRSEEEYQVIQDACVEYLENKFYK